MFIGHLPGAYLAFRVCAPRSLPRVAFAAGMIGSVAPDLDLFWFYFVDMRAHHHHEYMLHRPALWAALLVVALALRGPDRRWPVVLAAFAAGALVHMGLDTIAGKIGWLWPFSDWARPLVVVPPTHDHWIKSFLAHWTFLVEIAITLAALVLWGWTRFRARTAAAPRQ
jgi:inner membrane protein